MRKYSDFLTLLKFKEKTRVLPKKLFWMNEKEMSESINDTETECVSVKDVINIYRTASNETTLVSEIINIINEEYVTTAPGQGKKTVLILSDKLRKDKAAFKAQHFLIFFLRVNLVMMLLKIFQ